MKKINIIFTLSILLALIGCNNNGTNGVENNQVAKKEFGLTTTLADEIVIAAGEWKHLPVVISDPGTAFKAIMTGTDDADLYVNKEEQPTESN